MLNKQLFPKDPTTFTIPNDGVTAVEYLQTPEQWLVLRYELQNMYVSPLLARALLQAEPDFAGDQREARHFLRAQYPRQNEISDEERLQDVEDVLELVSTVPGKLPVHTRTTAPLIGSRGGP